MKKYFDMNEIQRLADKQTDAVMRELYGQRYVMCEDLTEDRELDRAWEYFNERFFDDIYYFVER